MKEKSKTGKVVLLSLLTLVFGAGIGTGIGYLVFQKALGLTLEEKKLLEGYRLLKEEWLFGNEEEQLSSLALKGMISNVSDNQGDPYTFYTDSEEEQGLSVDNKGFGFSSHSYDGGLYITEIHPSSPAEKSKLLKVGDVLFSVRRGKEDIYDFRSHSSSEIHQYLQEKVDSDTTYTFTVSRGEVSFQVSLKKGDYSQKLVSVVKTPDESNDQTLLVKINTFLGDPVLALKGTLEPYKNKAKRLVFDLRGNGGGYVQQAEEMAKMFVKKGTMIDLLVSKNGERISSCYQKEDPIYSFSSYGIILDSNSASATESFTLAMRAGCNTTVYGFQSFGKGIAQKFKYFSDKSVIRYTYAYVYGQEREHETMYDEYLDDDDILCIHKKGILPDKPYSFDYQYLASVADYTSTLGISTYGQEFFLKAINEIKPNTYPTSYSSNYHFSDAIKQYGEETSKKYEDSSFSNAFNRDGTMNKKLNDRFIKECYDIYLKGYEDLTKSVEKIEND